MYDKAQQGIWGKPRKQKQSNGLILSWIVLSAEGEVISRPAPVPSASGRYERRKRRLEQCQLHHLSPAWPYRTPIADEDSESFDRGQSISSKRASAWRISWRSAFRCSMASRAKCPCFSAFLLPFGAPDPGAPPCIRQRLLPLTAGDMHGMPARVFAPQRELWCIDQVSSFRSSGISTPASRCGLFLLLRLFA